MTPAAVVFDWGGTLAATVDVELIDLWRTAAEHLDPAHADTLTRRLVAIEQESWARTVTTGRSSRLMDLLRLASDELEVDVADAVLEEAARRHLDSWTPSIIHDPDAAAVLAEVRAQGLLVGLLSNTHWPRSYHEHFLARDGLADLIDQRVYTSEIDWAKPHRQAFATVAQHLDVPLEACVFVGDRPVDDVQGAKAAGMRAVWRRSAIPGDRSCADAVIDRLPELLPALQQWRS